jgi:hypothetical protein
MDVLMMCAMDGIHVVQCGRRFSVLPSVAVSITISTGAIVQWRGDVMGFTCQRKRGKNVVCVSNFQLTALDTLANPATLVQDVLLDVFD